MTRIVSKRAVAVLAVLAMAGGAMVGSTQPASGEEADGKLVEISPSNGRAELPTASDEEQEVAAPTYWLGIHGVPVDNAALRTHLQLADGVGVVVEDVAPESPAAKAGLRRHDVLLDVNGEQISDMAVLQKAVGDCAGKPIELKLIRLAKEMTLEATPEERPADLAWSPQASGEPGNDAQRLLEQFQRGGRGGGIRLFGPGMVLGGPAPGAGLPGGVQVNVTREGDGPAKVTVRRGEESWTVEGDDAEALAKLPADLRPFVEQVLRSTENTLEGFQGGIGGGGLGAADLERFLRRQLGGLDGVIEQQDEIGRQADEANRTMLRRMEEMEEQLQQLQRQLGGENSEEGTNPPTESSKD